jgi:hypothetical protein
MKKGYCDHVNAGLGILRALREDITERYLRKLVSLAQAEVFTDFLDMAQHLVSQGYKDPSDSLGSAVLEDGLRKIAEKNCVTVKSRDDLNSLNHRCADAGLYNRLMQKRIQVWNDIRNNADHGHFGEYSANDVEEMITGVQGFLADHL